VEVPLVPEDSLVEGTPAATEGVTAPSEEAKFAEESSVIAEGVAEDVPEQTAETTSSVEESVVLPPDVSEESTLVAEDAVKFTNDESVAAIAEPTMDEVPTKAQAISEVLTAPAAPEVVEGHPFIQESTPGQALNVEDSIDVAGETPADELKCDIIEEDSPAPIAEAASLLDTSPVEEIETSTMAQGTPEAVDQTIAEELPAPRDEPVDNAEVSAAVEPSQTFEESILSPADVEKNTPAQLEYPLWLMKQWKNHTRRRP
jgi:hypothetical protein